VQTRTTQGTFPKTNSSPLKNGSWESALSFWGSAYFQGRTLSFGEVNPKTEQQQECADQLQKKRQRQLLCYWPIQFASGILIQTSLFVCHLRRHRHNRASGDGVKKDLRVGCVEAEQW